MAPQGSTAAPVVGTFGGRRILPRIRPIHARHPSTAWTLTGVQGDLPSVRLEPDLGPLGHRRMDIPGEEGVASQRPQGHALAYRLTHLRCVGTLGDLLNPRIEVGRERWSSAPMRLDPIERSINLLVQERRDVSIDSPEVEVSSRYTRRHTLDAADPFAVRLPVRGLRVPGVFEPEKTPARGVVPHLLDHPFVRAIHLLVEPEPSRDHPKDPLRISIDEREEIGLERPLVRLGVPAGSGSTSLVVNAWVLDRSPTSPGSRVIRPSDQRLQIADETSILARSFRLTRVSAHGTWTLSNHGLVLGRTLCANRYSKTEALSGGGGGRVKASFA